MKNHFNFQPFQDKILITNDFGRHLFLSKDDFQQLCLDKIDFDSELGHYLQERFFIYDGSKLHFSELVKAEYRRSKQYLFSATSLHIFVLTNACNFNCIYCQAQSETTKPKGKMSKATAERAVDIALSSPANYLSFEFQGGEPLFNFDVLRHIVCYTQTHRGDKHVAFSVVSNLTLLTDEMIAFFQENLVHVSTSIDGDEILQDYNRPSATGKGTFQRTTASIKRLLNNQMSVGAIQTTTRASLAKHKEIVDTYRAFEFNSIFIRPLTPLGFANSAWEKIGYSADEFVSFYGSCLDYIIALNKSGYYLKESHAAILLSKILTGQGANYMELRSPCGASVGQLAYYFDGNIFTCDEGRMLWEMGDDSFKLGTIENTYDDLVGSSTCKATCVASVLESLPSCCDCVYHPYCGTCPVINLALERDIFSKTPGNYRCQVYKGIMDKLFSILYRDDPEDIKVLESWIA